MSDHKPITHAPWIVRRDSEIFARPPFLRVSQQTVEIADGTLIEDYYQVDLRSFALCVPILETGKVQVIRQYKHGPRKVCLGFPAGFLDQGEDPAACAERELLEETGLAPARLTGLGQFVDNGNQRGSTGHYFVGTGCRPVAAPDSGDLEEFEYLDLSLEQVDAAIQQGEFAVIHHIAAWGLARLHLDA